MKNDQRVAAHRAKMKRKAERIQVPGFTPMDDKRFRPLRLLMQMEGRLIVPNTSKRIGGVSASVNRHTGQPHEHKREIARRLAR